MWPSRHGLVALLGVSLLFGGCQADVEREPPPEPVPPSPSVSFSVTPDSSSVVYASSTTPVPDDFPMVVYWDAARRGEEFAHGAVSQAELAAWSESKETALAACMKSKGFLYFPRPWDDQTAENARAEAMDRDYLPVPKLPETRAEVQAVGYGVHKKFVEEPDEPADKNTEYVDSLSVKERSAYYIALYDVDITAANYDPWTMEPSGGCGVRIERDYPAPRNAKTDRNILDYHSDILSEMTDLSLTSSIYQEKPVIKLNRQWRSCMAGKGFALDNGHKEGSHWDGPIQAYMRAVLTDPAGNVVEPTDDKDSPDEQSRLVGSDAERKIALLDFDCRVETDYLPVFIDIQRKREQDFVKANRKALDNMRAFVDGLA
jgi:hypothetical protein